MASTWREGSILTQSEADDLLAVRKWFPAGISFSIPPGESGTFDLESDALAERFVLDTYRGSIALKKVKLQHRARSSIVLARLDLNGARHTNPDGARVECPHLHLYREGYEDKWAFPLDPAGFSDPDDLGQAFADFCALCSIGELPDFQESLL